MKICFLLHSAYGIGGTIRTTLNTASALIDLGHEVDIVSVHRSRDEPKFDVDPRISVIPLVDGRKQAEVSGTDAWRRRRPSRYVPKGEVRYDLYNGLVDRKVTEFLGDCDADVIVGTRPALNVYLAKAGPRGAVKVGQEHMFIDYYGRRLAHRLYRSYRSLSAVVTVSASDADRYRERMPRIADRVHFIPNSIPAAEVPPSNGASRIVVAAGRMTNMKRFDLLIRAFHRVAAEHPDWRLRIYGSGPLKNRLQRLIDELELHDSAMLMGPYTPIDTEWAKGSIAAVASDFEPFGLTIVEAMGSGLPVVATACRYGPQEIISDGVDGILTKVGDPDDLAAGLGRLIGDDRLRAVMAVGARQKAEQYLPERLSTRHEALFHRLLEQRGRNVSAPKPSAPPPAASAGTVSCQARSFTDLRLRLSPGRPVALVCGTRSVGLGTADATGELLVGRDRLERMCDGVWELRSPNGALTADRIDSRALLTAELAPGLAAVPFAKDGRLAVRVWRRSRFAEIERLSWADGELRLSGRLIGERSLDGDARLLARPRNNPDAPLCGIARPAVDGGFTAAMLAKEFAAADVIDGTIWDLSLLGGDAEVRLGRILDDVAQRKDIHRLAAITIGTDRVKPYFNADNELSVRISRAG